MEALTRELKSASRQQVTMGKRGRVQIAGPPCVQEATARWRVEFDLQGGPTAKRTVALLHRLQHLGDA